MPQIAQFAAVAAVFLFLGAAVVGARWRDIRDFAAPVSALQQARNDLRNGDYDLALPLFKTAADHGDADAQYWLGYMSDYGLGGPRDPQKAIGFYKQAADKNVVAADLRLGDLYLNGDRVPPDTALAESYLQHAAYQGEPRAAMLLSQLYRDGIGIAPDPVKAYAWAEVATIEGNAFARQERSAIQARLDVKDQQAAVARTKDILAGIKPDTSPTAGVASTRGDAASPSDEAGLKSSTQASSS
jgi:TPR repeat protein